MKKIIMLLMAAILLAACSEKPKENAEEVSNPVEDATGSVNEDEVEAEPEAEEEPEQAVDKEYSLEDVVNHFEKQGFEVGEKTFKAAEMIGAADGFGIELDGEQIELYSYDADSPALQEIQDNGSYNMDGFVLPAIPNGTVVLMRYDGHPEKDKVIETFNNF